jgi:hypothetical protein
MLLLLLRISGCPRFKPQLADPNPTKNDYGCFHLLPEHKGQKVKILVRPDSSTFILIYKLFLHMLLSLILHYTVLVANVR